jgi:hypothetical protein
MSTCCSLVLQSNILDPADPNTVKSFLDLNMMCLIDGRERSVKRHWTALLGEAGFKIEGLTPTRSMFSVLAVKPE